MLMQFSNEQTLIYNVAYKNGGFLLERKLRDSFSRTKFPVSMMLHTFICHTASSKILLDRWKISIVFNNSVPLFQAVESWKAYTSSSEQVLDAETKLSEKIKTPPNIHSIEIDTLKQELGNYRVRYQKYFSNYSSL